jgi:hypothetical protein
MGECLTAPLEQSPPEEGNTGSLGCTLCDLAVRSKAWVCGRSLHVIAGSNPSGSMDIFLLRVSCVVR